MRSSRAKILRRQAVKTPAPFETAWHGQTLYLGGVARVYRDLKREWVRKGLVRA